MTKKNGKSGKNGKDIINAPHIFLPTHSSMKIWNFFIFVFIFAFVFSFSFFDVRSFDRLTENFSDSSIHSKDVLDVNNHVVGPKMTGHAKKQLAIPMDSNKNCLSSLPDTTWVLPSRDYEKLAGKTKNSFLNLHPLNFCYRPTNNGTVMLASLLLTPSPYLADTIKPIPFAFMLALLVSFFIGLSLMYIVNRLCSKKIQNLASEIEDSFDGSPMKLTKTNVTEINELIEIIEKLEADSTSATFRLSAIVDMVGITLGGFEIDLNLHSVYMTNSLFRLYNIPQINEQNYISDEEFFKLFPPDAIQWSNSFSESIIDFENLEMPNIKYLRIRHRNTNERIIGIIIDCTEEMVQKQQLQYERNYDVLTGLLSRNSYLDMIEQMIEKNPDSIGAIVFGDMDNLKFMNDLYGHDIGDRYIITVANALRKIEKFGGIAVRLSGDEFIMFVNGYSSVNELEIMLDELFTEIRDDTMILPDNTLQRVQISFGVSFYPQDSNNIETLVKYADFALYDVKHTKKGETKVFDRVDYESKSFLLNKNTLLDTFFEERKLAFHFQPIVDVETGEVYGYEALMRPDLEEIKQPIDLIELAKANFKLPQLENLTRAIIFDWMDHNLEKLNGKKLFYNSIPNVELTEENYQSELYYFENYAKHMVLEITEQERMVDNIVHSKMNYFRKHGGRIAIDDYGSGYANDYLLLNINPNMIKLDMTFVRDIDTDMDKQSLAEKIIYLAKLRGIEVIAEGIETKEELDMVVLLGVNYVQGFYLARPNEEIIDIEQEKKDFIHSLYFQHQKFIGY